MSTPLLAPIYRTNQAVFSREGAPEGLILKRYQVLKQMQRGWSDADEVVFDTGIVAESAMSDDTFKSAKRVADNLNAASFQAHISGRDFTRYQTNWYVSVDEAEAQRQAGIDHTPADKIKVTTGVKILYHTRDGDGPSILWSDGRWTKSTGLEIPPGGDITQAAFRLIRYALEAGWRKDNRWRLLLDVESYESETLAEYTDRTQGLGFRSTSEYKLEKLTTDTHRTLWLVSEQGGCLGEDGDAWENYSLFDNEHEARAEYRRQLRGIVVEVLQQAARYIKSGNVLSVARSWPTMAAWAESAFDVVLPLQIEIKAVAEDPYSEVIDEHGWAMYLEGFASAITQ